MINPVLFLYLSYIYIFLAHYDPSKINMRNLWQSYLREPTGYS